MGLFDFLKAFFSNSLFSQPPSQISYPVPETTSDGFAPLNPVALVIPPAARSGDYDCYKAAFNYVTSRIYARPNTFKSFLPAAAQAFVNGDTKAEKKIFESFGGYEWKWPEYEQWFEKFFAQGEWPFMWEKYPGVCLPEGPPDKPDGETYKRFLKFLKVAEVKNLALKAGLSVPPKAKRDEIDELIIKNFTLPQLKEVDMETVQTITEQYNEYRQKHLAYLLQQTISHTACNIRDLSQMGRTSYSISSFEFLDFGCPVENAIAKEKSKIKPMPMPPFFPGDRSQPTMRQKRRR